jgi:hypothetical protein
MSDEMTADAHNSRSPQFSPFPVVVYNPGAQYCADRFLWDAYHAALLVAELQERARCREIVNSYLGAASERERANLLAIADKIQNAIALPTFQPKCVATQFGQMLE